MERRIYNWLLFLLLGCISVVLWGVNSTSFSQSLKNNPPSPSTIEEWLERGNIAYGSSNYREAWESWKAGYDLALEKGDRPNESELLINLGIVSRNLGQNMQSQTYMEQALTLAQELEQPSAEEKALRELSSTLWNLGQYEKAREIGNQALRLARGLGNELAEANALTELGNVSWGLGHYAKAQDYNEQALRLARKLGEQSTEALILLRLGNVAWSLGQNKLAKGYYDRTLRLALNLGERRIEALALLNLGNVWWVLGSDGLALGFYEQALMLTRKLGDRSIESMVLNNLGNVSRGLEQYEVSLNYHEQALILARELGARSTEALALLNLGNVALSMNQYKKARNYFEQGLVIAEELDEPETQWRMMDRLQVNYRAINQMGAAIFFGKQAVNTLQRIRHHLTSLDPAYQKSFIENYRSVYKELADLLIEEGRLWEAQQVLDMLKDEEYFHFIRRRSEADSREQQAVLSQIEQQWDVRYEAIRYDLVTIGKDYKQLNEKKRIASITSEEEIRLAELDQDLRLARHSFNQYFHGLQKAFSQLGGSAAVAFGEKDLKSLKAFQGTLERLGQDTVLIHFLPMDDQLRIILTTANAAVPPFPRESPVTMKELNTLIFEYREILQNPRLDPTTKGKELYQAIFDPLERDLQELEAKNLLVYLDGVMRYLPLSALYDGEHYIAERYGVIMYTTAAKAEIRTLPTPQWRVAGLGVSHGAQGFQPLPAVAEELDGIIKDEINTQDVHGVLPGRTFLNTQFSAQQLQTVLQNDSVPYSVIHLASHFHFRPGSAVDSYLMLGEGKRLTLAELQEGHYPLTHVDLLTLSACETGIGSASTSESQAEGRRADGREVEGFGVLAQNQGAKAVIATLWSVADRSTGQFMQWFYQLRETEKLTKAEALRRVQEMFIRGEQPHVAGVADSHRAPGLETESTESFVPPTDAPYAHPYYWGPFILMGNFL